MDKPFKILDAGELLVDSKFQKAAKALGDLVTTKNIAYGNSFVESTKVLKIMYPNGVSVDQYNDMLGVTRVLDKLFRIATRKDAFEESPWKDIAGYGLIMETEDEEKNDAEF